MELRTLQYFLAVTKEENITRAAESLHISQPYLSKQLMDLEKELGKQLLIRGKRKVTLTEDGILLRKHAEEILSLVEKTEYDLSSNNPQISGEVAPIFHRRAGLQQLISHWADTAIENFNIAATYNVVNGSPVKFIRSGLGFYLTTKDLLSSVLEPDVCFRPLNPPLEIHYALIWKRAAFLSKAAEMFLQEIHKFM